MDGHFVDDEVLGGIDGGVLDGEGGVEGLELGAIFVAVTDGVGGLGIGGRSEAVADGGVGGGAGFAFGRDGTSGLTSVGTGGGDAAAA